VATPVVGEAVVGMPVVGFAVVPGGTAVVGTPIVGTAVVGTPVVPLVPLDAVVGTKKLVPLVPEVGPVVPEVPVVEHVDAPVVQFTTSEHTNKLLLTSLQNVRSYARRKETGSHPFSTSTIDDLVEWQIDEWQSVFTDCLSSVEDRSRVELIHGLLDTSPSSRFIAKHCITLGKKVAESERARLFEELVKAEPKTTGTNTSDLNPSYYTASEHSPYYVTPNDHFQN